MITISTLTDSDVGKYVNYCPAFGPKERGRIKAWNAAYIFVVYSCNQHCENYQNYTAAATLPENLEFE